MPVLTLELTDKLLDNLKAEAEKAHTSVEQWALLTLGREAELNRLREEAQAGLDALREGRYTEYASVEEMMNDIIERGNKRLSHPQNRRNA